MSRQSYMTGFCKAASAAGVDPQELAQYVMSKRTEKQAQESKPRFQTNGWAPRDATGENFGPGEHVGKPGSIPTIMGDLSRGTAEVDPIAALAIDQAAKALNMYYTPEDPRERAWLGAHTNALEQVMRDFGNKAKDPEFRDKPLDRMELRNLYDYYMNQGTNTANSVASPRK